MQGYNKLYAAIFRQAMEDDVNSIKASVLTELENRGYSKPEIKKFISDNKELIKSSVQPYILKESEDYPCNNKGTAYRNRKKIENLLISQFMEDKP